MTDMFQLGGFLIRPKYWCLFLCLLLKSQWFLSSWFHLSLIWLLMYEAMNVCTKVGDRLRAGDTGLIDLDNECQLLFVKQYLTESLSCRCLWVVNYGCITHCIEGQVKSFKVASKLCTCRSNDHYFREIVLFKSPWNTQRILYFQE